MKCKHFKKMAGLVLTTVLTVASALSTSITSRAAETINFSPSNVLNVQVVDEEGNVVSGIDASLVHSSSTEYASWETSSNEVEESNNSGVKDGESYTVPYSFFEELIAPSKLLKVKESNPDYMTQVFPNGVPLEGSGDSISLYLEYLPFKETALTVPANTLMVNADAKWATGYTKLHIITEETDYLVNDMTGTLQSIPLPASGEVTFSQQSGGFAMRSNYAITNAEQTEYVKARVKLSDITSIVTEDGMYVRGEGDLLEFASGAGNPGEAYVRIISGSVVNYPVPDDEGYVEFYVLKSTLKYDYLVSMTSSNNGAGGGKNSSDVLDEKTEIILQGVEYPSTGATMIYVPAGQYTINLTNVPAEYETPDPVSYTVVDQQEAQTCKIVLEKAHQHSYGSTYETDADNHWYECSCGDKKDLAAHTPGAEATETTDQVCTVCDYVITPALGHQHSYGSTYETDADNHWYECSCGDKKDLAAHTPGAEATETTDQVCTVCDYVITPALGHQHSYGNTYETDADNHWYECSCGDKKDLAAHTPGAEATETTDQVCTVCGYVITRALGHQHSYSSTYKTDADNHWKECACGDKTEEAAHSFDWVIDKEATVDAPGAKHEECSFCAYEKASVEIPQLKAEDKPIVGDNPVVDEEEDEDDDEDEEETVAPASILSPKTAEGRNLWACLLAGFVLVAGMATYCYRKENKQ